jgi:hypothetical protein
MPQRYKYEGKRRKLTAVLIPASLHPGRLINSMQVDYDDGTPIINDGDVLEISTRIQVGGRTGTR